MTRSFRSHALRVLVAVATTFSPFARVMAETSATDHLTPQSVAAVTVRLADVAASPVMQDYPVEVLAAATEDFLGLPLESLERVTLVVDPPVGATPQYAVFLDSTATISFAKFRGEITEKLTPTELLGRPALTPPEGEPMAPWICLLDDNTLAIGPKLFLKRFIRGVDGSKSELADAMRSGDGEVNHAHAAVMLKPLRPFVELGLMAAKQSPDVEPEVHELLDGLLLLDHAIVSADFAGERDSYLDLYTTDKAGGDKLQALAVRGFVWARERLENDDEFLKLRHHEEAVVRAWASYVDRMIARYEGKVSDLRKDDTRFELGRIQSGDPASPLITTSVIGVLVALLLPAVQAAREAARRNQSMNNLRQINLAWHNYHDTRGGFPPQAIMGADGAPLLSWRVAILPYVEEQELYEKFHLDEPWDSPHNSALLPEMPLIYLDPSSSLGTREGKASYLGVMGPDAALNGEKRGRRFPEFSDGTSKTITVIQVDDAHAVPWTKPADFRTAAHGANPIGGIGTLHPGGFLAGFADAHVEFVAEDIAPEILRALMTINGGEAVELP